jgi:hypothetical protein
MTGLLVLVSAWRHASFAAHGEHIRDGLLEVADDWAVGDITLYHGAAPGGDAIASVVARRLGWLQRPFPADWATHGRECGTTASGTRHCMGAATRAGIPVRPYPLAAPVNTQIKETTS